MLPLIPLGGEGRDDREEARKRARTDEPSKPPFWRRAIAWDRHLPPGTIQVSREGDLHWDKVPIPEYFTIRLGVAKKVRGGGEVLMILDVDYETVRGELWPNRISMRGSNEGSEEGCLEISLNPRYSSVYVASLLRGPTPQECEAWRVEQPSDREGVGRAVMETVTTIADHLFENDALLYLQDASAFTVRNAPLLDVSMTAYLRLARGFGFYEGLGYAEEHTQYPSIEKMRAVRESALQWHEALFATPLRLVEDRMLELYGQDQSLATRAERAVGHLVDPRRPFATPNDFVTRYADWSVRDLLKYLERESERVGVDPRNDDSPPDMPTPDHLRVEWAKRLEEKNPDAAGVLGFLGALDMKKLLYEEGRGFFQKWLLRLPGGRNGHSHMLVTREGVVEETVSRDGLRLVGIDCAEKQLARNIRNEFFEESVPLALPSRGSV